MNRLPDPIFRFWLGPVGKIRLDTFRACLGLSLLCYMTFRWQHAKEWLTDSGFHISPANLPYFDWSVPLLSDAGLAVFGAVFFFSIIAFTAGWQLKWTGPLALAGLVYASLADQLAFFSPNKLLIVSLLICTAAAFSERRSRQVAAWPVRVLQGTIIIHFFMAGLSKVTLGGEWLTNPYAFWTQAQGTYRTEFAAFLLNTLPLNVWPFLQWGALLFELLAPWLLVSRRLRPAGLVWGVLFQIGIALTMKHLIYFNLIISCFFVLFLSEEFLSNFRSALIPKTPKTHA